MMEISEYPRNTGRWLFDFSFTVGKPEVFGLKPYRTRKGKAWGADVVAIHLPKKTTHAPHR